ncbi:MAG: excinuclease ABC subunit UvrC [Bernardetiaceae bacterium]
MPYSAEQIRERVRNLPQAPGVYRFFSDDHTVIYVGKAKDLRKRVSSYFTKSHQKDPKTKRLVEDIRDLEYTVVNTETDALLLENNLIKNFQPRYNILLKDGKSYPYICLTKEPFPRVFWTRQPEKQPKAAFYGPYTNKKTLFALLELVRKLYTLRTCQLDLSPKNIASGRYKVCLEYHIKNCKGPCEGLQSETDYLEEVAQVEQILKGKLSAAKAYFREQMEKSARVLKFEQAQRYKEKFFALDDFQSRSLVTNPNIADLEVFTIQSEGDYAYVNYLKIEEGCIVRAENEHIKKKLEEPDSLILEHLILNFRERFGSNSPEIITNEALSVPLPGIEVKQPKIGDRRKLIELSLKNGKYYHKDHLRRLEKQREKSQQVQVKKLELLQKDLGLKKIPYHIECFDNSNLQGTNPVASMVCFKDGKPSKRNYRKFNIKTVEGIDDFASMHEVVTRRYQRLKNEGLPMPDLVVVDGGKGQLSAAVRALKELDLYGQIPIIGLAKRLEEVYYPNDSLPHYIGKQSPSLALLQHIRNEAHRFAITFHRQKRSKNSFLSVLDGISGVGEKTIETLLGRYRTINNIAAAPLDELSELIGKKRALLVLEHLKKEETQG